MRPTTSLACAFLLALASGCGGGGEPTSTTDTGAPPTPDPEPAVALFAPPAPGAGAPWGAVPYPNDLLLDAEGKLDLHTIPGGPNASQPIQDGFIDGLRELDGAGIATGVWFAIDGDIDSASLPGNVALLDLETGESVAVTPVWREDLGAVGAILPIGGLLRANTVYGAYLTTDIATVTGGALEPTAEFTASVDQFLANDDPAIAAAQASLAPLLRHVDDTSKLAVATVFRTENTTRDAVDMRDVVLAAEPPSAIVTDLLDGDDLDDFFGEQDPTASPGGDYDDFRAVPHGNVAAVVHGTIKLPDFRSAERSGTGLLERDENGAPIVKAEHRIAYTLFLPTADSYADLPVAVYAHGLGRSRVDAAYVADSLAAVGIAVLAIDQPFHGDRRVTPNDSINEITGESGADGIADRGGLFPAAYLFQLLPNGGFGAGYLPALRANMRQAAIDLVSLAHFVTNGSSFNIANAVAKAGLPSDLTFRDDVAMVGESLGGLAGLAALAIEPAYGVAVFTSPAAGLPFPAALRSAVFGDLFFDNIAKPFDILDRLIAGDPVMSPQNDPIIQMYTSVMAGAEAGGFLDALRTGDHRGGSVPNLLITASWGDDTVHNSVQEHIASSLGMPALRMSLPQAPPDDLIRYSKVELVDGPVANNVADGQATMVMTHWYPASHAVLRQRVGIITVEPDGPPFIELDEPKVIENPIVELHGQMQDFLEDHMLGRTPSVADPYAP